MANFKPQMVGLDSLRRRLRGLKNLPKIQEAARKKLVRSWEAGADAFIRAAIRRVLVDTGMSAATFLPLSRAIARVRAQATIEAHITRNRKAITRRGIPTFPRGERRAGFQSELEGDRLGERAYTFQTPNAGSRIFVFRFSFQSVAFQHAIHEDMQQSLDAGIDAYLESVRRRFTEDARLIIRAYLRGKSVSQQGIE